MYAYASKTQKRVRAIRACSLSAAGGSTGLVEPHGFAQPASKVYFLHFRSFDEYVTLQENQKKENQLFVLPTTLTKNTNNPVFI